MEILNVENLNKTLLVLKDTMIEDSVEFVESENVQKISKNVLSSEKFLNSIKNDISAVLADGKITMADLPRMISILLKSNTFLNSLKNSVSNIEFEAVPLNIILKYCSLALFHYLMLNGGAEQYEVEQFLLLYPSLWCLAELSLPVHETNNKKDKIKPGCC